MEWPREWKRVNKWEKRVAYLRKQIVFCVLGLFSPVSCLVCIILVFVIVVVVWYQSAQIYSWQRVCVYVCVFNEVASLSVIWSSSFVSARDNWSISFKNKKLHFMIIRSNHSIQYNQLYKTVIDICMNKSKIIRELVVLCASVLSGSPYKIQRAWIKKWKEKKWIKSLIVFLCIYIISGAVVLSHIDFASNKSSQKKRRKIFILL